LGLIFLEWFVDFTGTRSQYYPEYPRHGGQAQTEAENRGERIGEFRFVKTQTEAEFVRIRHSGQA